MSTSATTLTGPQVVRIELVGFSPATTVVDPAAPAPSSPPPGPAPGAGEGPPAGGPPPPSSGPPVADPTAKATPPADGGQKPADGPKKDDAPPGTWKPARQSWIAVVIFTILIVAGVLIVLASWRLWPFTSAEQGTEDAYVRGDTTVISPQVSGYVNQVLVRDFAFVEAGQVLVRIDPSSYEQSVEQDRANVDAARANLANNRQTRAQSLAQVQVADASIASARAQLKNAESNELRSNDLARDGSLSEREADQNRASRKQAIASLQQAEANRESALQQVRSVEVNRGALSAAVEGALAAQHSAEINLSHTVIRAPRSGQLGQVGVRLGAYVTSGTQLLYLVPPLLWVTANFKEAQTRHMAPGQPVWFTVDALGGARLRGHLERLSPATGSEFAVMKSDNATGNFTKVPQRISARILVDSGQPIAQRLRAGMSVETHVDTSSGATNQPDSVSAGR